MPLDEGREEMKAKPRRGQADDGRDGGQSQGGQPSAGNVANKNANPGTNAQRGAPAGSESDRSAPGAATHKKADDLT